jgi:predicted nuclease of predicted toxin-antitoxin system
MIKYYTDTNIAKSVTVQLRLRGVDIIRCEDVGLAEADDLIHLEYAAQQGRAIVTNDRGFARWHTQWLEAGKTHAGIFIVIHDKENIGMIVNELLFWHDSVIAGAAELEKDVYNQIQYMP